MSLTADWPITTSASRINVATISTCVRSVAHTPRTSRARPPERRRLAVFLRLGARRQRSPRRRPASRKTSCRIAPRLVEVSATARADERAGRLGGEVDGATAAYVGGVDPQTSGAAAAAPDRRTMSSQPSRRPARTPSTVAPSAASTPVAATRTTARSRLAAASVLRSPTHDQGAFDLFAAYDEALLADLADLDSARAADASKLREQFRALTTSAANAREQLYSPAGGPQERRRRRPAGCSPSGSSTTAGAALDGEAAALEATSARCGSASPSRRRRAHPRGRRARAPRRWARPHAPTRRVRAPRGPPGRPGDGDADATPPSPTPERRRARRREAAAREGRGAGGAVEAWWQRKMREKARRRRRAEAEKAAAAKKAAAARRADDVKLQLAARAGASGGDGGGPLAGGAPAARARRRLRHQRAGFDHAQQRDAAHVERWRRALEAKAEPTRARAAPAGVAERCAARPATPRDESRVLQPTTASASRPIDPEQGRGSRSSAAARRRVESRPTSDPGVARAAAQVDV